MPPDSPDRLFHGSPARGLSEIEPRSLKVRSQDEGPVVFATPTKAAALKNLFWSDDSWTALATMNGVEIALIAKNREAFIKEDRGGSCYELPGQGFICETKYGGGHNEWTSRTPVTPIHEEVFPSALDAMVENGVQVYFAEPEELAAFESAEDKIAFLRERESENERRGAKKPEFPWEE